MRRSSAGFTLLELLTVIAVMAILAAIAIPGFGYLAASTKVKGASTELYLAMVRTRSEAVKRNRSAAVIAHANGWQAGWRVIVDANNDGDYDDVAAAPPNNDRLISEQGELRRVDINLDDDGEARATDGKMAALEDDLQVIFRPTGRISGAVPEFEVASTDQDAKKTLLRCVRTDLTGRPFVKAEACP